MSPQSPASNAARVDLSDLLHQLDEPGAAPPVAAALTDPRDVSRPERQPAAVITPTGGMAFAPVFASFAARFAGLLIDTIATLVLMTPGLALVALGDGGFSIVLGLLIAAAGFVLAAVLYARSVSTSGRWFGNAVTRTTVVDVTTGAMLTKIHALTRFVARMVLAPFLFGFLVAFRDSQRRAFHDQIAGSIVTRRSLATWSDDDDD